MFPELVRNRGVIPQSRHQSRKVPTVSLSKGGTVTISSTTRTEPRGSTVDPGGDSSLYETWAAEERERLQSMFLESADRLAEVYIQQKRFTDAVDTCQRLLANDNCWERAYRNLMQAYAGLGDRGQIGRTYQRCVQILKNELDVAPSPETETLYQQLVVTR